MKRSAFSLRLRIEGDTLTTAQQAALTPAKAGIQAGRWVDVDGNGDGSAVAEGEHTHG